MNRKAYAGILAVVLLALSFLTSCGSSSKTPPPPRVVLIAATSGTPQSATVGTAFAALVATVTTGGTPTSGVTVTFTAPATGASGTFAGGVNTAETNASGVATSTTFTANATVGGPYTVAAKVTGVSTQAEFNLTNTASSTNSFYSFYLTGMNMDYGSLYAVAGSVTIDTNGNVLAGKQDYNDDFALTSPEPSGDRITGGALSVDPTTGQGTLILITDNTALGRGGTETLGVQFANTSHALVVQFDQSATSSGSMDLQTLTSPLSGGYAFTLSGDPNFFSVVAGGVFSISGTSMQNGLLDVDDAGSVTLGMPFTGTISAPDSFGRGTITGTGIASAINYYIVGPEAIRIIEVDGDRSFVGSAFAQGAGTFDDTSLGSSVFGVESNAYGNLYVAAGMFATVPASGTFQGVADNDEEGLVVESSAAISGTYSIASNGYGRLTITSANLGNVSALGIYMTDPNLNLNDPNNTTSGLGGALVADLDLNVNGTGVLTPQTDTSPDSFASNYAFGAQGYSDLSKVLGWEFDFVGQGSVMNGVLSGTGLVSDPFAVFSTSHANYSGVPFAGTATPDGTHAGRYTIPLNITAVAGSAVDFQVVIYQASGGQLFWMGEDNLGLFLGPLEQQGSLTGLHAARKARGLCIRGCQRE